MKTKLLALASILILFAGCDDFFDINDNPNNPTKAELNTILPYIEASIFGAMGIGTAGVTDILAVYNHHLVQRGNHDDYRIQANEFQITQPWDQLYTKVIPDIDAIIARKDEAPAYAGIAQILRVYVFSAIVDMWGDMPYSQAGNPVAFKFPAYDDDMAIYADLFKKIDTALVNLNAGGTKPAADDLVYQGNMAKWIKFANSLKLNMYNKVRLTTLYDQAAVNALMGAPLMETGADDFKLKYTTSITPENRNPGFVREYAQSSPVYFVSPYFWLLMNGEQACQNSLMVGIDDPRVPYYFYNQLAPGELAQNPISYRNGEFLSIWFGSYDRDPNEGFDQNQSQTIVGLYPVGGAYDNGSGTNASGDLGLKGAGPQRLLTSSAIEFVKAELALTTATAGDERQFLINGMTKAFAEVNALATLAGAPLLNDATQIQPYINAVLALYDAGNDEKKLEIIMTQKWIQEFGNGLESWNDIRRTGYPIVCDPAQDENEWSIQTNPFPAYPNILPYNQNDLTNNGNAPEQQDQYSDKVFWDLN